MTEGSGLGPERSESHDRRVNDGMVRSGMTKVLVATHIVTSGITLSVTRGAEMNGQNRRDGRLADAVAVVAGGEGAGGDGEGALGAGRFGQGPGGSDVVESSIRVGDDECLETIKYG